MNKIAVVTALVGVDPANADKLYEIEYDSADYYVFTDQEDLEVPDGWNKRIVYPSSMDKKYQARRACKTVKQLTHLILPEYDYYIWHDYCNRVGEDPNKIVKRLGKADMALFKHPVQNGWKGEMYNAAHREHPEVVKNTIHVLENVLKVPNSGTVWESTGFIRKNNKKANECFTLWNDLLTSLTSRDQVTWPVAIHYTKPKIEILPGRALAYGGNNKIIPNIKTTLNNKGLVQ